MKRKLLFAVMTLITGAWSLSANAQEDITSQYLTNADLSTIGTGWTYFSDSYKYGAWRNHNTETVTPCVEFYAGWGSLEHTDFKFSQTVTLPAGDYRIAVNAFFRNTNDGDGTNPNRAWIFAGTKTQNVVGLTNGGLSAWSSAGDDMDKAAAAFKSGAFSNAFDFTLTEEQTIEIGFQGRFAAIRQWCILGPVKLYKYSLENYLVDYRAAVSTAQGIIDGGKQMDADVLAALQAAMVDESTLTTSAQVVSATSTLNDAIAAANASIAKYEAIAANEAAVAGAALDNPITTSFVVNPTFSDGTSPWQSTTGASNQGTASNQTAFPNLPFWENWHSGGNYTGKMYQVIENIPNGVYELDMWAFVNHFGDGTQQYIYANGDKTYLTQGAPLGYKVFTEVTNNTIEIGLEQAAAVNEWMGLDDAVLIYYGSECTVEDVKFGALVQQLDDLKAQIRAITAVPQALIDADEVTLDSYDSSTYTSAAQYEAAITDLQAVLAARQAAETSYAKLNELKGYVTALLAVDYTELVSGAHAALEAASTDESSLTSAAAIDQAYTDLKDATMTYVANADPAEGSQFDLTFLLTNPDVTSFWDGTWYIRPEGWYNDQNIAGQNFQVMANNEMGPGGEVFMEYWAPTAAQEGFVLYQKVTLPEGTYKMTGRVGLQQLGDGATGTTPNMTFSANDTDGSQIAVGTLADQEVEFINSTNQEVKIGIKAHPGNSYRWIGINKIKLYKAPTENAEYTINVEATNADVAVTVDGVAATAAKKLDAVKFAVTIEAGSVIESISVTYIDADNNTQTITPTDLGENNYTFQMPAFAVTITVVASIDKSALAAAIAGAEPYLNEALPAAIMTALNAAYTTAQDIYDDTDATAAEVTAATDALNFTVMDVQNAISSYAAYLELKPYADALVRVANDNATANGTLADAISDAEDAVSGATGYAEIDAANEDLRTAMDTYAADANPVGDGAKFDLTYMLVNPDVTKFYTGAHGSIVDGWYTEQEGGNFQVVPGETVTADDGVHKYAYEYWSEIAKANNLFALYQKVNLAPGTYKMSCYAFAGANGVDGATVNGVYFFANDTQGSLAQSDHLTLQEVEFVNGETQEVKIGLKTIDTNQFRWMGIGYLELYKIPSSEIVLDPDDPMIAEGTEGYEADFVGYDYKLEKAGDVTLRRPIKVGLNTLVLPFSMTQAEVEATFGEGSKISILKEYNSETESLRFTRQEGVVANRPCLLKATQAIAEGTDILIEGRTLVACESGLPSYAVTSATMYGTYAAQTTVPVNSFYVQNGELVYAEEGAPRESWVNMTRAYITLEGWAPDASGAKSLNIFFDDEEATGIATLENGKLNIRTGKAYDLSGREVKNPTKGLYIIDGKKVFLK